MVPGAWKVFALGLVLLGVLEGVIEWEINNKMIKIAHFITLYSSLKKRAHYLLQRVLQRVM